MTRSTGIRRRPTKTLLWIGFGGLLLLLCALGASSISFLYQVEVRHEKIRREYVERDRVLEKLRAGIYVSGTYFRDFAVANDETRAAEAREQFLAKKTEIASAVNDYVRVSFPADRQSSERLRSELKAYFAVLIPALAWNSEQRAARSYALIQAEVLPRRALAISLTDRIQQLSQEQLTLDGEAVSEMFSSFRTRLVVLLVLAFGIGSALAATTMWRLLHFERLSELRFQEVVETREELKHLSADLLSAQEDERRRISRELHDEVGQVLSAVMLALGNLRSAMSKKENADHALRQLQLIEDMTQRSARVVRNLSLLLRPTMLDDLGLVAALKWLSREVSRTTSLQVGILADEAPDELPEEHRTCVYRVVQEALRNASRHSGAHHASISLEAFPGRLLVSVQDDGKGFDPQSEKGMGILGMEERVQGLGGSFRVDSGPGRGAKVSFELPLPDQIAPASPASENESLSNRVED